MNSRAPIFIECTKKFNDATHITGGLVSQHEKLIQIAFNPDTVNDSGNNFPEFIFKSFKKALKHYCNAEHNWTLTGKHQITILFNYCNVDIDPLYIHLWLQKLDNPELRQYCSVWGRLKGGMDSSNKQSIQPLTPVATKFAKSGPALLAKLDARNAIFDKSAKSLEAVNKATLKRENLELQYKLVQNLDEYETKLADLDRTSDENLYKVAKKARLLLLYDRDSEELRLLSFPSPSHSPSPSLAPLILTPPCLIPSRDAVIIWPDLQISYRYHICHISPLIYFYA